MRKIVDRDYSSNYLASLFKNASRCKDVISKLPDLNSTSPTTGAADAPAVAGPVQA